MNPLIRIFLGVAALALAAPAMAFQEAVFVRASDRTFSHPHDLAFSPDGKRLFVADMLNDAVKVLDPDTLQTVGEFGKAELSKPHDLAFDQEGRLLVADTGNDRIAIYAVSGASGRLVGELREGLAAPEGVAVGPDRRVYVSNTRSARLTVFADGKKVAEAGGPGRRADNYSRPHDIEVDASGNVYVVDSGNHRVVILDRDLKVQRSLIGAPYNFNEPKYLFLDERGRLWVADQHNHRVKVFEKNFMPAPVVLGSGVAGAGPNQLDRPEGVVVRGNLVWVSDTYNDRIVLYRFERQ